MLMMTKILEDDEALLKTCGTMAIVTWDINSSDWLHCANWAIAANHRGGGDADCGGAYGVGGPLASNLGKHTPAARGVVWSKHLRLKHPLFWALLGVFFASCPSCVVSMHLIVKHAESAGGSHLCCHKPPPKVAKQLPTTLMMVRAIHSVGRKADVIVAQHVFSANTNHSQHEVGVYLLPANPVPDGVPAWLAAWLGGRDPAWLGGRIPEKYIDDQAKLSTRHMTRPVFGDYFCRL
eukprot:1968771-Amphidinium_carterae.1